MEQNKQNIELHKQMIELAKESKVTTINNNCNNKNKFNMNIFLNEKCKDALNIMDFIDSLQLQLKDLEETGRLGYIQGISRIFINGLKELDVSKRPIHCSDIKREVLYVKDQDAWEKDQEKERVRKAIRKVANKNVMQITDWIKENPDAQDFDSKKNEEYNKIIGESMGGKTDEDNRKIYQKIIRNVAKHVMIEK
jgi:hypothetical protein